jgi:O-antigen ligase
MKKLPATPFSPVYLPRLLPSIDCQIPRSQSKHLEIIGLVGICLYSVGYLVAKDICYVGEWMMVGAFLMSLPKIWRYLKRDPLFVFCILLAAYLFVKACVTSLYYDTPFIDSLDSARELLRFSWVIVIAWWIGGSEKSLKIIFCLVFIGFLCALVLKFDPSLLNAYSQRKSYYFGYNTQHLSLYLGTTVLWVIVLGASYLHSRFNIFYFMLWLILVSIIMYMIILSQTRTIWIGLAASFATLLGLTILNIRKKFKAIVSGNSKSLILYLLILIAFISIIYYNNNIFYRRYVQETKTIHLLLKNDIDSIEFTSFGKRLHLWRWSFEQIEKKPLLGWRIDNTSKYLLKDAGELPASLQKHSHVENSYLEILLNHGIIGFLFLIFCPLYIIFSTVILYNKSGLSFVLFGFFCSLVTLFSIANLCDAYITSWIFWPYFSIFFGGIYSVALWSNISAENAIFQSG